MAARFWITALVCALALTLTGVEAGAKAKMCFEKSNKLGLMRFSRRSLACSFNENGPDEACCGVVRKLFGDGGDLAFCLCEPDYYTNVLHQVPVDDGVTAEKFVDDMADCGIPIKGSMECPSLMATDEAPNVQAQFLLKPKLFGGAFFKGFAAGSLLGGGGAVYYYYDDDDDDDDDDQASGPIPIPPYTPPPSPSPAPGPAAPAAPAAPGTPTDDGGFFGSDGATTPAATTPAATTPAATTPAAPAGAPADGGGFFGSGDPAAAPATTTAAATTDATATAATTPPAAPAPGAPAPGSTSFFG